MKTAAVFLLLAILATPIAQADCLKDGQDVVFSGRVSRETFPGRPNYSSIEAGDEPETVWILTVSDPNCVVSESMEDGEVYEVAKSTKRFQLVFADAKAYERYKSVVERRALVHGQLFVGHTGHHHAKVLIEVREIKADDGK